MIKPFVQLPREQQHRLLELADQLKFSDICLLLELAGAGKLVETLLAAETVQYYLLISSGLLLPLDNGDVILSHKGWQMADLLAASLGHHARQAKPRLRAMSLSPVQPPPKGTPKLKLVR